jgi:hypothetical protein
MSTKRKITILEVDTTSCDETLMIHFTGPQNQYLILYFAIEDFENWILSKGYFDIDYEEYNPISDTFKTIKYTITKEDFFSDDDYHDYQHRLAKEFVEEMLW